MWVVIRPESKSDLRSPFCAPHLPRAPACLESSYCRYLYYVANVSWMMKGLPSIWMPLGGRYGRLSQELCPPWLYFSRTSHVHAMMARFSAFSTLNRLAANVMK
ncbi:hypothetical protein Y032_0373g174 [Ancylostoma ceylanicum]|uniref:Uncharacterized protein n=1 Tax=Ancylostoma ceylanicum TaxID=53326 RepID=A0A016RU28_9BILA|nr:hypothetical protein Y032_0373g174 [Ancylostoma ceylanicum]